MPKPRRSPRVRGEEVLPESTFRREVFYRDYAERSSGIRACGFLMKTNEQENIVEQTSRDYVAVYVLRGRGEYVDWEGRRFPLVPGSVAQRIPGKVHSTLLEPQSGWVEVFVVLHPEFFNTLVRLGTMDATLPVLNPGLHRSLVDRFEDVLTDMRNTPGRAASTLLLAHRLIVDIYALHVARAEPDQHAEVVQAASAVLSENLGDRLSMPDVAESFHMSYERFRKVFRARAGMPPGDYRIRRRIDRACRLLVQERLTAREVAYRLGYPDDYSFSKQFKKVIGVSPDAFRRGVS